MAAQPQQFRPELSEVSTGDTLTHSQLEASVSPMANAVAEPAAEAAKEPRKSQRAVSPIMVYPQSDDQRTEIEDAARREGLKLSPFLVFCAKQYINNSQK